MKVQRLLIVLSLLNLGILMFELTQISHAEANSAGAPVLRASALELVDDRGRVRAEIKVLPAQPALKMPDGATGYPEAVQLRLINSEGRPNVKLVATEDGSALLLGGESDPTYVQILARGATTSLAHQQRWPAAAYQALRLRDRFVDRKKHIARANDCETRRLRVVHF